MGFITGFVIPNTEPRGHCFILIRATQTGGVTLTLGIAYLTVYTHERNRQAQALYLRSQHQLLNSLVDPVPVLALSRAEFARQPRNTFTEIAKDRWNEEVENAVRWVQNTDWDGVRFGMEGAVARLLGRGLQSSRQGVEVAEKQMGPKVQEAVNRSKVAARKVTEQAAKGVDDAAAATIAGMERASEVVSSEIDKVVGTTKGGIGKASAKAQDAASLTKASVNKAVADTRAEMQSAAASAQKAVDHSIGKSQEAAQRAQSEAQRTGAGTVDAARGALRHVVSKGVEMGKEVIGKAQEVVGLATEKTQSISQGGTSAPQESDIEKALRQRYEMRKGLDRSEEEVLRDRYTPLGKRDNTVLRGV